MNLPEIKTVEISDNAVGRASKFIIAEISNSKGSKIVMRCSDAEYHNDIAQLLIGRLKDFDVRIKGGGKLYLDTALKTIWFWGKSTAFGAPDYGEVRSLLKMHYPDFKLVFEEYSTNK